MTTVGFLARGLEPNDTYNRKSWALACELAQQRGCRLLMVAGSFLNASDPRDRAHPAVFRLVSPALVDRALLSQTVTNRATAEQLNYFDHDLADLPLVSFTIPVGSRPTVGVDNAPGLRALMRHLIDDHGCRRIVHVRGPRPNVEAEQREQIWRQELERAGIVPEVAWLVPGDFDFGGLQTIGQDIVDRVGWDFDAVVACNDMAALRVMTDLQALGARIPEDHLVCGFDDIQSGQYSKPSLTTVTQPLDLQTALVWDRAEAVQTRQVWEGPSLVDSVLVRRASCSCPPARWDPDSFPLLGFHGDLPDLVSDYEARRETFQWAVYDLHNFLRDMNGVLEADQLPEVLLRWLPRLGISSFVLMTACAADGTPLVHEAFTAEGTVLPTAPPWFRVTTAFPPVEGYQGSLVPGQGFSLHPWLDHQSSRIHGLFPLVVGDLWYGLAVFELSPRAGLLELTIQEQMASVLDRLDRERLHREHLTESRSRVLAQEDSFRALQRLVAEVAHEINTPLGAILSSVEFLESWDSERGLDEITQRFPWWRTDTSGLMLSPREKRERRRVIAEVLIQGGRTDASSLAEQLVDLGFDPGRQAVTSLLSVPGLEEAVPRLVQFSDRKRASWIVAQASQKLSDYVSRLRQTSQQLGEEGLVLCNVGDALEGAWLLVRGTGRNRVVVEWSLDPVPPVLCRPRELQQVWTNLIRNACQSMGWQGTLTLRLRGDDPWVLVEVTDQGPGIPAHLQDRIFTPFFTTKPEGEGMGLGLDLCRRIVGALGGTIGFESVVGRTTFFVRLPLGTGGGG